jgi:hypothetical protein
MTIIPIETPIIPGTPASRHNSERKNGMTGKGVSELYLKMTTAPGNTRKRFNIPTK